MGRGAEERGSMTVVTSGTTAPWPTVQLDNRLPIVLLTPRRVEPFVISEAYASASPTPVAAIRGFPVSSADRVTSYRLSTTDGELSPFQTVDRVRDAPEGVSCYSDVKIGSFAVNEATTWWRQQGPSVTSCDLYVDGMRVPSANPLIWDQVIGGGSGGVALAMWQEWLPAATGESFGTVRLRWSRRDSMSATWTPPAAIAPVDPTSVSETVHAMAAGPNGVMAVLWSPMTGTPATVRSSARSYRSTGRASGPRCLRTCMEHRPATPRSPRRVGWPSMDPGRASW